METLEIPRVPWSQLGGEFAVNWGYADPGNPQPEDVEIIGMKGSGKTHLLCKILQDRMLVRNTRIILVVTKQADEIFAQLLGWPVVQKYSDIKKHRQVIYWPQTKAIGDERRAFHEKLMYELLAKEWRKNNWCIIAFDEIAYVEGLSSRVKGLLGMYWREARSMKIALVAMKQRPQGILRDMHSETQWTIAFRPKDEADAERFAELFGPRREWLPVMRAMNPDNHEFLIRHARTGAAYISWVDTPVVPIVPPDERKKWLRAA